MSDEEAFSASFFLEVFALEHQSSLVRSLGRQRRRHRREQTASALSLPSSTNLSAAATLLPMHPYVLALLRFLRSPLGDVLPGTFEAGVFVLGPAEKA